MSIIAWLVVGGLSGWLASIVMKTSASQGLITDILVGIVGAFIGGYTLPLLGIGTAMTGINLPSIATAFVGAVIFLGILRLVRR